MARSGILIRFLCAAAALCLLAAAGGCWNGLASSPIDDYTKTPADDLEGVKPPIAIPTPIDLLLPTEIRIHQFTQLGPLDEAGKVRGLDVQIEAFDAFDDPTKAFGDYRFELYTLMPNSLDRRGSRLTTWDVPLQDPKLNLAHWQPIDRRYRFKLEGAPMVSPTGKFFLVVYFTSPYTHRLEAERAIESAGPKQP